MHFKESAKSKPAVKLDGQVPSFSNHAFASWEPILEMDQTSSPIPNAPDGLSRVKTPPPAIRLPISSWKPSRQIQRSARCAALPASINY